MLQSVLLTVHPDLDIVPTGSYCIQIGLTYPPVPSFTVGHSTISAYPHGYSFAHSPVVDWHNKSAFLYRPTGHFLACLPISRLLWLRDIYLTTRSSHPNTFLLHSSGDFLLDLASLLHRYPLPKDTAKPLYPNEHWSPPTCFCPSQSTSYPITHHRFATPLTVPITSPLTYFSFHPADSLFGAKHNPFSEPWHGTSFILPPFKPKLLDRVTCHALASVSSSSTPTTIIMLLPHSPGSLYMSRIRSTSPTVSTHTYPLPPNTFSFPPPSHHSHRSKTHPSPPLFLIHLSNNRGDVQLQQYLRSTPPPPPLSPPPQVLPNPFSDPLLQATLLYPPLSPLRWVTQRAYYTDGSYKPHPHRSGAAFYPTHQATAPHDHTYTVYPAGLHETNTITRAELCGAASALEYDATFPILSPLPLTLFLDSLVSLYLIQSALHAPHTLTEKKHAPLQLHIATLLLSRASLGYTTHLQKVTSHTACIGNDRADVGAATALLNPSTCTYNMSHINNQHFASLPAWPCFPPPIPPTTVPHPPWFAADLTTSLNAHIDKHHPNITAGGPPDPLAQTYPRLHSLQSLTLPIYNNLMWTTSSCTWSHIKTILQIRSKTLYTASSHTSRPYTTAYGSSFANTCPICPHYSSSPAPRDTIGHWLGSCTHPHLKSSYIARHNRAVCLIQSTLTRFSPSSWYTVMDASSSTKLPPGVASTRLPAWLLPHVPHNVLKLLRPDILIVQGLDVTSFHTLSPLLDHLDPPTLASLKSSCTLHLVELTFTSDDSYNQTLLTKKSQHFFLASLLLDAGWSLATTVPPPSLPQHLQTHTPPPIPLVPTCMPSPPLPPTAPATSPTTLASRVHILILTHSCTLSRSIQALLSAFSIPSAASHSLLSSLSIHTVRSAHAIVTARRHIERNTTAFLHPSRPHTFPPTPAVLRTHDPP